MRHAATLSLNQTIIPFIYKSRFISTEGSNLTGPGETEWESVNRNEHASSVNHQCVLQRSSKLFQRFLKLQDAWAAASALLCCRTSCIDLLWHLVTLLFAEIFNGLSKTWEPSTPTFNRDACFLKKVLYPIPGEEKEKDSQQGGAWIAITMRKTTPMTALHGHCLLFIIVEPSILTMKKSASSHRGWTIAAACYKCTVHLPPLTRIDPHLT